MQAQLVVVVHHLAFDYCFDFVQKAVFYRWPFFAMENRQDIWMNIGERLLLLRQAKGLSQRELAKRAGVTNSAISMIETNRVSPSVSSLEKVLSGLGLSLVGFFSDSPLDKLDYQVVYRNADLLDVSLDDIPKKLVGKHFPNERSMSVTIQTYPGRSEAHIDENNNMGERAGYLIKGEITLELQGERYSLNAGDSFYFESHLQHRFINNSVLEAQLVCVCSPGED